MTIKNDVKTKPELSLIAGSIEDSWPVASRLFLASKTDGQIRQNEKQ